MIDILKNNIWSKTDREINSERNINNLFFSHEGRRHCHSNNYPSLNLFRQIKSEINHMGVFVDAGDIIIANDPYVGLIGETKAILFFTDNSKIYKLILMHGAKAKVIATNHTVILLANMSGCDIEIEKDDTVIILS